MIKSGIPFEAFIERANGYNVGADPWPFADVAPSPDQTYTTDIGFGKVPQDGPAVGKLVSAYGGIADFHVPNSALFNAGDRHIQFTYGDEELDPVMQTVVGIPMAVEVAVDRIPALERPHRLTHPFRLRHIAAITPPLCDPAHTRAAPLLGYKGDYAQGRVIEHTRPHHPTSPLQLAIAGVEKVVALRRYGPLALKTPDGFEVSDTLQPGDTVRIEISCNTGVPEGDPVYHTGNTAYLLKK